MELSVITIKKMIIMQTNALNLQKTGISFGNFYVSGWY